jgi:hypothetical protein
MPCQCVHWANCRSTPVSRTKASLFHQLMILGKHRDVQLVGRMVCLRVGRNPCRVWYGRAFGDCGIPNTARSSTCAGRTPKHTRWRKHNTIRDYSLGVIRLFEISQLDNRWTLQWRLAYHLVWPNVKVPAAYARAGNCGKAPASV